VGGVRTVLRLLQRYPQAPRWGKSWPGKAGPDPEIAVSDTTLGETLPVENTLMPLQRWWRTAAGMSNRHRGAVPRGAMSQKKPTRGIAPASRLDLLWLCGGKHGAAGRHAEFSACFCTSLWWTRRTRKYGPSAGITVKAAWAFVPR